MVVSLWRLHFAREGGANVPFPNMITIKPDAQTGKWNWPCRELKYKRTLKPGQKHSRFGECFIGKLQPARLNSRASPALVLPVKKCR
jgi:hypothetical protein